MLIGGVLTKKSIGALGQHGHTTATHYTAIAADLLVGVFPTSLSQYCSGLLGWCVRIKTTIGLIR